MERNFREKYTEFTFVAGITTTALVFLILESTGFSASTIEVCSNCEIKTIHEAVEKSKSNDTILIHEGTYSEGQITIKHPLRIKGEHFPKIDGLGKENVFLIQSSEVSLEGFEIFNSGVSYVKEFSGIRIENATSCTIQNNRIHDNMFGIYLADVEESTILNNEIRGVPKTEADTGNGIHIWKGKHVKISKNHTHSNRDGIYFEFVTESEIEENLSHQNMRYGLHFMNSHKNRFSKNVFTENGAGVAVMYSRDVEMDHNRFTYNQGTAAYGLLLKEITGGKVIANQFLDNSVGVYMEGANRIQFTDNDWERNGWALRVMGSCEGNVFKTNNFKENMFEATTNSEHNNNEFSQNYWSDYNGYDYNRDGVGDQPHRLVNVSSVILERVDSSLILMRSFLFTILNELEKALPDLIPEKLKDDQPLMKPLVRKSL